MIITCFRIKLPLFQESQIHSHSWVPASSFEIKSIQAQVIPQTPRLVDHGLGGRRLDLLEFEQVTLDEVVAQLQKELRLRPFVVGC
jgi:hypothetical protein